VTVKKENEGGASAPEGSAKIADFDIQTEFFSRGAMPTFGYNNVSRPLPPQMRILFRQEMMRRIVIRQRGS